MIWKISQTHSLISKVIKCAHKNSKWLRQIQQLHLRISLFVLVTFWWVLSVLWKSSVNIVNQTAFLTCILQQECCFDWITSRIYIENTILSYKISLGGVKNSHRRHRPQCIIIRKDSALPIVVNFVPLSTSLRINKVFILFKKY